jgi:hypothetical protein
VFFQNSNSFLDLSKNFSKQFSASENFKPIATFAASIGGKFQKREPDGSLFYLSKTTRKLKKNVRIKWICKKK